MRKQLSGEFLSNIFSRPTNDRLSSKMLENDSHVAVIGGGPAGSFFSYFLLDLADRIGLNLHVDIYEPRDFSLPAPRGCNMCAGVVSETLVQNLATEGINIPGAVVQQAIGSYILHTDVGSQRLDAASNEKRIAAIFRGGGPRAVEGIEVRGFDGYLLSLAKNKGAKIIPTRVTGIERIGDHLCVQTREVIDKRYDLLVAATGVNTAALKLFKDSDSKFIPPQTTKTSLREYHLGQEIVEKHFGNSLHVFLLDIPKLNFAMIVPKGDYVSVCILGKDVDDSLLQAFMNAPEVKSCFPVGWRWDQPVCQCFPRINIQAAIRPFDDRVIFIGDSGVTRLYKDGIGAAYRAAKAAATCAILEGVSSEDFRRYYAPFCRKVAFDNRFGKLIFSITHIIQRVSFSRKAMLRMVAAEQLSPDTPPRMSSVLWDSFTGSAPYQEVFIRTLHPAFVSRYIRSMVSSFFGS